MSYSSIPLIFVEIYCVSMPNCLRNCDVDRLSHVPASPFPFVLEPCRCHRYYCLLGELGCFIPSGLAYTVRAMRLQIGVVSFGVRLEPVELLVELFQIICLVFWATPRAVSGPHAY
jgi:hypothetical protein